MAGIGITTRFDKRKKTSKTALRGYVFEQLKTTWRDCVRAFILETIKYVHVDTGMSMASMYGVAAKVRIANIMMAELQGRGPRKSTSSYVDLAGNVQPGQRKTIELGKSLGRKAYKIEFGTPEAPDLIFEFDLTVFQYKMHEFGSLGQSPWDSLEYGRKAFIQTWYETYPKRITTRSILEFIKPNSKISSR